MEPDDQSGCFVTGGEIAIQGTITEEELRNAAAGINQIEGGGHLSVIPFQFIKIGSDIESVVNIQAVGSQQRLVEIEQPEVPTTTVASSEPGSAKGKYYKQTYRPAWEELPECRGWLRGVQGEPRRAYCTYCQRTLHAHRLSLLKHTCTIRHQQAAHLHESASNSTNKTSSNPDKAGINTSNANRTGRTEIKNQDTEGEDTGQDDEEDEDSEEDEGMATTATENKEGLVVKNGNEKIIPVSTHVIDNNRGVPVHGLNVSLYKLVKGRWTYVNEGLTDSGGRCSSFFKDSDFSLGRYKLHYDVDRYFLAKKEESPFPFIEVVFDAHTLGKYHFPLLISPNSYTTYKLMCFD